ncbi:MAG TPA: septal ring lytic transglycosylase RlpA family protein [Dongiaceae bacterium]|nr:septal ring lytic transglycosylase RlpA family protein [Dongiaceae bacterium]
MWRGAACFLLGLFLGGCAETTFVVEQTKVATQGPAAASRYKIGNPYQINGVWYYPAVDYNYDETGIASWYGPGFDGHMTAQGEVYDQNALTAAHKTLPMPTLVRVTNLENGRQIQVRINDRGPFVNDRIIDLSRRAAQLLGMDDKGTAKVRVQVMAEESRQLALALGAGEDGQPQPAAAPAPKVTAEALPGSPVQVQPSAPPKPSVVAPAPLPQPSPTVVQEPVRPTNIFIQAGAFLQPTNADRLRARLAGVGSARVIPVQLGAQRFYRVRVGPIATVEEADRMLDQIIAMGNKDARLVVE